MGLSGLLSILPLGRQEQPPKDGAVSFPSMRREAEAAPPFGSDAWLDQIRREREERIFESRPDFPDMPHYFSAEGFLGEDWGRR